MWGVFGVRAPARDVARLTYFGLHALQHRGQESAGIAVSEEGRLTALRDLGLVALKSGTRQSLASFRDDERAVTRSSRPSLRLVPAEAPTVPNAAPDSAPPLYTLRRSGSAEVGPVALGTVLEWVATARVPNDSEVSRSGGPFMPISAASELGRFVSRPLYRFFEPLALFAQERHAIEASTNSSWAGPQVVNSLAIASLTPELRPASW